MRQTLATAPPPGALPPRPAHRRDRLAGSANRASQEEDHRVKAPDGGGGYRQAGAKDGEDDDTGSRCLARPTPSVGAIRRSASSATVSPSTIRRRFPRAHGARQNAG
jgi:hypothetical protein